MELTTLSATKLAALMREREVSPVEVVAAYLQRIELLNPRLNAIVTSWTLRPTSVRGESAYRDSWRSAWSSGR